jgi:virulence-associated protein VagC
LTTRLSSSIRVNVKQRMRFAKLFSLGYSQAVRLPRDMNLDCARVRIRKIGETVILEPIPRKPKIKLPKKFGA